MNGIGADTTIKAVEPSIISTCRTAMIVVCALFVVTTALWTVKAAKFRKTESYAEYKAFKKSLKNK